MNILQLNFEQGWRGGERQTLLSMMHMRDAGHRVALLARRGGELAARAREAGFVVHAFGGRTAMLAFLVKQGRSYDILHAQTANMVTWLALFKPRLGKLIFTRRTAFPIPPSRASRTLWKWRRVDALVAISEAAAAEPRRLGLSVSIIPSAVQFRTLDEAHAQAFSQEYALGERRVLATAAALTREKDPCTLLRAVHRLSQERGDFIFVHMGAGGDAEEEARALHRELDLGKYFVFAGYQPNVEDLYRLMDVFVLSSRHEALGTSVLDAFLYGVPVVATSAGGLAHSLADGRGLQCAVGDDAAMARGMSRLLSDRALRAAMIDRAAAYVRREHDPAVMASRYLALYRQILDDGE